MPDHYGGMKTSSLLRGAVLFLTAALVSTLTAETDKLSHADKAFFEKAAKSGMKEVDVSQAVVERLMNPGVRAFAQSMISDHNAANSELMALAARKGAVLPADKMKDVEKWSKKNGNIDKDYIDEMKEDHDEAVKLFEKAAKSDDAEIAAFAQKTLPALQHHLAMAKSLKETLK